jgi:hypothetical protein
MEFGQRFIFKEAALRLAEQLRQDHERNGWHVRPTDTRLTSTQVDPPRLLS